MKFSAVILAGGKSTRMGHDKAWLTVSGKSLIARQTELVRELGAAEVFISGRTEIDYGSLDCPVLMDRFKDAGPLAGIERALAAISTPRLFVLAVDMPRMNVAQVKRLLAACADNCGAIPRFQSGLEPLAAVYPASALNVVTDLLERKCYQARYFARRCVELNLAACVELGDCNSVYFQNWNSLRDVQLASGICHWCEFPFPERFGHGWDCPKISEIG